MCFFLFSRSSSSSSLFKIMKFSTTTSTTSHASPLSSSISTNTTPMCNSKRTTTSGCLTAILQKILCSGTLPNDSSNQIEELGSSKSTLSVKDQNFNASEAPPPSPPPIVARLMGLESMGEIKTKPTSLSRSRSMNSVDYFGECNRMQSVHKRVSSTLSFREAPNFLLTENENFLVLSFENERKKQKGCAESKQKVATERVELKENKKREKETVFIEKGKKQSKKGSDMSSGNRCKFEDIGNNSKVEVEKKRFDSEGVVKLSKAMNCKERLIDSKKLKRRKKRTHCYTENKIEIECKSEEDLSPVSVLDFERESSGTVDLSSRRKLSPELENDRLLLLRSDGNLMIDERKINFKAIENNKYEESKKKEKNSKECVDIWGGVCRLVEDELSGSNRIHAWMNKQSDLESICADFESEIFDQLLNEMIDQFV